MTRTKMSGFWMVRFSNGWGHSHSHSLSPFWKHDHLKSDLQKVNILNVSRFWKVGFQIPILKYYIRDPKSDHSKTGSIRNLDVFCVRFSNVKKSFFLPLPFEIWSPFKIRTWSTIWNPDTSGFWIPTVKYFKSSFLILFKKWTIWWPDGFGQFKYLSSLVFRSPLFLIF